MIKLYLDEDVHKIAASSLRIKGYDVISAHDVSNWGLSDIEQLEYAVSEKRAIFTFNAGDFDKMHKAYIENEKEHYGIILSKQIPLSETNSRLIHFLFNTSAQQIKNNLLWL